jgi:hypothetical protein
MGQLDVSAGTDCLRVLNNQQTVTQDDALVMIIAGVLLFVYHTVAMDISAHAILSTALLAAEPFYEDMFTQPHLDPITFTPVLVDTAGSLVRREVPVIRVRSFPRDVIDRTCGLCWSFVPLLQDLCEISMKAKASNMPPITEEGSNTPKDVYTDIDSQIRMWEPNPSSALFTTYTTSEISIMLLQARLYRLGALLIIHLLRYPLGVALTWANLILAEISACVASNPDGLVGMSFALPVLVAHAGDEAVGGFGCAAVSELVFAPKAAGGAEAVRGSGVGGE